MKQIFIFLALVFSLNLSAQINKQIKLCSDGDTIFWYKWSNNLGKKFELNNIVDNNYKWYFRLWTEKQVIDIWEDVNEKKYGKITSWTEECTRFDERATNRIFYFSNNLNQNQIEKIIHLRDSLKINSIPNQSQIDDWYIGNDGITYLIETKNSDNYCLKTYWSPEIQGNVEEAIKINFFINNVLSITNANQIWSEYREMIPFECYVIGETNVTCKPLTKKERKKYKRERRKYIRQHEMK